MYASVLVCVWVSAVALCHGMSFEIDLDPKEVELEVADPHTFDGKSGPALGDTDALVPMETGLERVSTLGRHSHAYYKAQYYHVTFSVYLSHSYSGLGPGQHIKFDRELIDDLNNYNKHTGVFTVPLTGVYQFSVVITVRHKHELRVNMMMAGVAIAGAVAEGVANYQDVQGSNSVIVHAKHGQSVWVQQVLGSHVCGYERFRVTSFSGQLLYQKP